MFNMTFPGIFYGTTGNIQGTMKVFGVNAVIVKKCCNATIFNIPGTIIKKVNVWDKKSLDKNLKCRLEFADRRQNPYN